jgi:hypothetical protein
VAIEVVVVAGFVASAIRLVPAALRTLAGASGVFDLSAVFVLALAVSN